MELKRQYTKPDGWEPLRNVKDARGVLPDRHRAPGVLLNPPPFSHITIHDTGTSPAQHFSERLVTQALEEGWMAIDEGVLTLYAQPENLRYTILRAPGRYSCFDGAKLPDDEKGRLARAYIAQHHAGQPSPDPQHPAGYECINYYECVLDATQHATYRIKKGEV